MAQTQEFYKTQGRQPRYATVLATFANGMYITNQQVPEGYAKYLVNYDIDDTGSFIYPRKGRSVAFQANVWGSDTARQGITNKPQGAHIVGPVWINDVADLDNPVTKGTGDIIWSLGTPARYRDYVELSAGSHRSDYDERYYFFYDYDYEIDYNTGSWMDPGYDYENQVKYNYKTGWILYYDEANQNFESQSVVGMAGGKSPARVIEGAWAFDKPFQATVYDTGVSERQNKLFRPVWCNYNNSIVMFSAQRPILMKRPNQSPVYDLNSAYLKCGLCSFTLSEYTFTSSYDNSEITSRYISPKFFDTTVTCATATTMGFNMLHYAPYEFEDTSGTRNIPVGIMCYAQGTNGALNVPTMYPVIGQTNRFRFYCQYSPSAELDYDLDYLDLNSYDASDTDHWVNLTSVGYSRYMGNMYFDWVPTTSKFLMRITMYTGNKGTTAGKATAYPYTRVFQAVTADDKGSTLKTYDLSTAKGMVSWLGCVGLYGVEGAVDGIFFSDVDNPGYFPFPNNVLTFDGTVYAVHNYMNNLLVVTDNALWLVQPGISVAASICTKVLDNLDITEIDATNIVVLKDSIFFKSGNAFYVLKPNKYTSDNTDLKKYVNSTAISYFLNNFTESVLELLRKTYITSIQYIRNINNNENYDFIDFNLLDNVSYLINEEVHYVYVIEPKVGTPGSGGNDYGNIELHLVYNTLTRAWRIYLMAVGDEANIGHQPVIYQDRKSRDIYEFFSVHGDARHKKLGPGYPGDMTSPGSITVAKWDKDIQTDNLVLPYEYFTTSDNFSGTWNESLVGKSEREITKFYENYNYIDTGDVALTDISLKRFRELQIAIYSKEHEQIEFYADFKVDGAETVSATKYDVEAVTDKKDPYYGSIIFRTNEEPNMFKWEDSTLDAIDTTRELWKTSDDKLGALWQLDLSAFPELDTINMRLELKGKGRRCSFQLLNTSLQQYQLSNWMWVYRLMNARRIK